MRKITIGIVSVFGISLLFAAPVAAHGAYLAQTNGPQTSQGAMTEETVQTTSISTPAVETKEYSGEILKVEKNKLTIDTEKGTQEFSVPANIKVERNSSEAAVTDLKPGDAVTVKAEGNEALSISATAGSLISKAIRAAIIVGLVLLLLLAVRIIMKKRNKGFVTTKPTNLSGEV